MRTRWIILIVSIVGLAVISMYSRRVEGDCDIGIKKEHLDDTPGAFVDDDTIEIGANGLQVKDGGITAAKTANLSPASYTGPWLFYLPITNQSDQQPNASNWQSFAVLQLHRRIRPG